LSHPSPKNTNKDDLTQDGTPNLSWEGEFANELIPADKLIGYQIGNYRLQDQIGEGATAVVYRAQHVSLDRIYAVKILHPILVSRPGMRERFIREAKTAAQLNHENIIAINDFAIDPHLGPYMVMEFLEGQTLQYVIQTQGALPLARILPITLQICRGLSVAHKHGIIHRDLKPENIFLLPREGDELIKILDFGIARLTQNTAALTSDGKVIGTPLYMSPEQCQGQTDITPSTDIYSFGIMLFEMLMGHPPFLSDSPHKLIIDHFLADPPSLPPSFPDALRLLQSELLAKKPYNRPPNFEAVAHRLKLAMEPTSPGLSYDLETSREEIIPAHISSTTTPPPKPSVSAHTTTPPPKPGVSAHTTTPPPKSSVSTHTTTPPPRPGVSAHTTTPPPRPSVSAHTTTPPPRPGVSAHTTTPPPRPSVSTHTVTPPLKPSISTHNATPSPTPRDLITPASFDANISSRHILAESTLEQLPAVSYSPVRTPLPTSKTPIPNTSEQAINPVVVKQRSTSGHRTFNPEDPFIYEIEQLFTNPENSIFRSDGIESHNKDLEQFFATPENTSTSSSPPHPADWNLKITFAEQIFTHTDLSDAQNTSYQSTPSVTPNAVHQTGASLSPQIVHALNTDSSLKVQFDPSLDLDTLALSDKTGPRDEVLPTYPTSTPHPIDLISPKHHTSEEPIIELHKRKHPVSLSDEDAEVFPAQSFHIKRLHGEQQLPNAPLAEQSLNLEPQAKERTHPQHHREFATNLQTSDNGPECDPLAKTTYDTEIPIYLAGETHTKDKAQFIDTAYDGELSSEELESALFGIEATEIDLSPMYRPKKPDNKRYLWVWILLLICLGTLSYFVFLFIFSRLQ
jgi:serine/threonine protein kinase